MKCVVEYRTSYEAEFVKENYLEKASFHTYYALYRASNFVRTNR